MKRIGVILLSISLAWSLNLRAGDTISNYSCDFEDEVQNLTWHFPANPSNSHHWTIGEAINNGGKRSLYVRPNDMDTTTYVNTPAFVYAYTDKQIECKFTQKIQIIKFCKTKCIK